MNDRSKVIDAIVNPNVLPGFTMIAGRIDATATKVATVSFPARGVFLAIGIQDTHAILGAVTVTGGVTTVAFTAVATAELDYFIIASATETYTPGSDGGADVTITPKQ